MFPYISYVIDIMSWDIDTFLQVGFVPYTILKSLVYRDAPTYWEVNHKNAIFGTIKLLFNFLKFSFKDYHKNYLKPIILLSLNIP